MKLGPLIRQYRISKGFSQKSYAKLLNISTAQMSKLEAGIHEPLESTALGILNILVPNLHIELLKIGAHLENDN